MTYVKKGSDERRWRYDAARVEREYEASDRRRYFVPCPECGVMQWLRFERLRWKRGSRETARYHSEACEAPIEERYKTRMLESGEWRATAEGDPRTAGFHISSLYSPLGWRSWAQIAAAWEAAQGSDSAQYSFSVGLVSPPALARANMEIFRAPYQWIRRGKVGTGSTRECPGERTLNQKVSAE